MTSGDPIARGPPVGKMTVRWCVSACPPEPSWATFMALPRNAATDPGIGQREACGP